MATNYVGVGVQNMCKDKITGIFYARVKIKGGIKMRSLDTDRITNARLVLADKLKEIRESVPEAGGATTTLKLTSKVSELADLYAARVNNDPDISDKITKLQPRALIARTWAGFFDLQIRNVSAHKLAEYRNDLLNGKWRYTPNKAKSSIAGNSSSTVNKLRGYLRGVFALAIAEKVITKNPASEIKPAKVKRKLLNLPTHEQWKQIVLHIRTKAGRGRMAGDLVEGLAYSGMRLREAGRVRWMDVDYGRGMLKVYGTKSYTSLRHVPMTEQFIQLTRSMHLHRTKALGREPLPSENVFEAKEATTSLAKASTAHGMEKMTHHDLRDLFATTCIEGGVDIPTLATYLGHDDGGVLAMSVYGHVRSKHAIEAIKSVKF
jgi:integrase